MAEARIELIATGDELLNGSIVDTNSPWLMGQLEGLGLPVWRKTMVRDDRGALVETLRMAASRSDVVVVSGGLGPTSDDLTAECAAEAAGVGMRFDEGAFASLEARMRARGLAVSANNRRQAMVPEGAEVIPNRHGTAPMLELRIQQARFFFLPGVPREYFALAAEELLPRLSALARAAPQRRTILLRCYGLPESALDQKLASLPDSFPGLSLAYRTTLPENHAKLTATGPRAEALLAEAVPEARRRLGLDCFGQDDETFSRAVGNTLLDKKATLALAESLTAGRAAALLAETPGASRYLLGGLVVYSERLKRELLGVPADLLAEHGAVSLEVAESMASQARSRLGSDYAVACTGLAGPEGDERHPVGTVMTALASPSGVTSRRHLFMGDRERIREFAAYATLDALRRSLLTS
jgi:nicotinamide-nucleotide amidase